MGRKLEPTRVMRQRTVKSVLSKEEEKVDVIAMLISISVCEGLDRDLTIRSGYNRIRSV